jgi:hypothetical protein
MNLLIKLAMVLSGTALYTCGELYKKELKYIMGLFIAPLGALLLHSWIPLLCWITYFIACEFGYGDDNPLTKLLGKKGAITFCGTMVGFASFPIMGLWCLYAGLLSGGVWLWLSYQDDAGKIKEPWVGIIRGLSGTICLLGA